MKRKGIHCPTIEDVIEISGIETLHPGGMALTKRTGQVAALKPGVRALDVSTGRGTQAVYYATEFGAHVTGVDLAEEMLESARANAHAAGVADRVVFRQGDSQCLPFEDSTFDATINECAVGIPDDSQAVLNEMARVTKPGGIVVMHESTWRAKLSGDEKEEISERYGTTPLEFEEWIRALEEAGVADIRTEFDEWSKPEMFWKIRRDRDVDHPSRVFSTTERLRTMMRVLPKFGLRGVLKAFENANLFFSAVTAGKLGYCLYWGRRAA